DKDIYFLDHPVFSSRKIYPYAKTSNIYSPNSTNFEEIRFLTIMNQAIAQVFKLFECNVYHGHDYQTALATCYLPEEAVVAISLHNAGSDFSTSISRPYYGGGRTVAAKIRDKTISPKEFSKITGIRLDIIIRHF